MIGFRLQPKMTWAEDRALLRSNPSADPGAKTEVRAVDVLRSAARLPLRDWHQSAKPSRQDAVTLRQEATLQLANAKRSEFQFAVNQDTTSSHIESTVKLINRRIKGSEKFWLKPASEYVLQLRADHLCDSKPLKSFWIRWQAEQTGSNHYQTAS